MTPRCAQLYVVSVFGWLALIVAGIVFFLTLPRTPIGPILFAIAVLGSLAVRLYLTVMTRREAHQSYLAAGERWWFNPRTGTVSEGEHARFRDGPYPSRETAERATQTARERAAQWNAED